MNQIVHVEIHAAHPERAATFYRDVFGWKIAEWTIPGVEIAPENRYWTVATGGIGGGIVVRRGPEPLAGQAVNAFVCTIGVASVDTMVTAVLGAGGTLAVPRMPIRGVGWLAYCKDTEGNIFGLMQNDPSAA